MHRISQESADLWKWYPGPRGDLPAEVILFLGFVFLLGIVLAGGGGGGGFGGLELLFDEVLEVLQREVGRLFLLVGFLHG